VSVSGQKVAKTALLIKKAIKQTGKSVRMVPHKNTELGSATVLYNKLTAVNGWELLIISDGSTAYLAQTVRIQDIDAYSARDQARPHRDAKVGMLPPKLAQIIINLSVGSSTTDNTRVLDPFCGTGVLLQEAMLMDYDIYGTDLEPRMIQYSIDNLKWLDEKYPEVGDYRRIEVGDATSFKWYEPEKITNVAAETYLGQPLSSLPASEHLSKIIYEVNLLHHKFLENIGSQIRPGTKLCLAVPTWRGKREFLHLPTLDYLDDLGYTRMRFKHVSDEELIYHRENQVVGRELLVLVKR
jgi:tRNA G10  N-methylase Trm11